MPVKNAAKSNISTDIYSKEERSALMSKVRGKDTRPEIMVRSLLHGMGYRFRIHDKALPGEPDIVLRKYNTVIFVNGCFWHQHKGCRKATIPKQNREFWEEKLSRNKERDRVNINRLKKMGWNVIRVWECELDRDIEALKNRLSRSLEA